MKTAAYILIAIAMAFGVYYFFFRKGDTASATVPEPTPEEQAIRNAGIIAERFSRADLFAGGTSVSQSNFPSIQLNPAQSVAVNFSQLLNP